MYVTDMLSGLRHFQADSFGVISRQLWCVPCRFEDAFPGTPYDVVVDTIGGDYEVRR